MSVGLSYKETPREVVRMKNTSGAGVVAGDLCVLKAVAAGDEVTTTTTGGDNQLLRGGGFMALETIANTASGRFLRLGFTNALKVDGTTDIAIGDRLTSFTAAGITKKAAVGDPYFATALEAYATNDSLGVIDAILTSPGAEDPSAGGGDNNVMVFPGLGQTTATLTVKGTTTSIPILSFSATAISSWRLPVKVPGTNTSISSVTVYYRNNSTTGNLYLRFYFAHSDTAAVPVAIEEDATDVLTTYNVGTSDTLIRSIACPAAAFNGLTGIGTDSIIYLDLRRDAGDVNDTYEATWDVIGVLFVFA